VLAASLVLSLMPIATALAARKQPGGLPARVVGVFVMKGLIVTAVDVRGERPGQTVIRKWTFATRACSHRSCRRLLLRRERGAGRYDGLVLRRTGTGRYAGEGRFYAGLSCNGRAYPRGEVAPYRITLRITRSAMVQGIAFATRLVATYTNLERTDRTACPLGPSHDAARYGGSAKLLPTPPSAAFAVAVGTTVDGAAFADRSARGTGGAPIVAWRWQFGDPASGLADAAGTDGAVHVFSAPGTYEVMLSVRDGNGLTSTTTQPVTVPASPAAP
jgi:hypothetical protein